MTPAIRKMGGVDVPVWKYSGKEVSIEEVERVEKALKSVCFGCGEGLPVSELHLEDVAG